MEEFSLSSSNRNGKDGCLAARLLASPLTPSTSPYHANSVFEESPPHLIPSYVSYNKHDLTQSRNTTKHKKRIT
ncbi:hypothetical protein BO83DRAFT_376826 [Aspergillus eucalypticola CBS 122712]|uniref:Uncharacterized protein n=1 Tax=Aspergillus eucalypticola (strain CBS 122712 / IBT 29274) TaxID=1448314 RepID=A0A317VU17_ASPEC|nr:uncharacterized protein BO83DRAFT_376826 [Aspergillus eucalypticola CBS 122712]PWY77826.1 hypothetical protein BO83DRAFT_376826 [Aspergillus eucalypticola CBS 122712]